MVFETSTCSETAGNYPQILKAYRCLFDTKWSEPMLQQRCPGCSRAKGCTALAGPVLPSGVPFLPPTISSINNWTCGVENPSQIRKVLAGTQKSTQTPSWCLSPAGKGEGLRCLEFPGKSDVANEPALGPSLETKRCRGICRWGLSLELMGVRLPFAIEL